MGPKSTHSQAARNRARYGHPLIEVLRVASLANSMLMTQSALGMYIAPLQLISRTFGVANNEGQQSWGAAAYSLTVGTFVLPSGRAGEIFGHKAMMLFGLGWFALWSIICGLSSYSHSMIFFDVARAMQGIGPAIMLPNSVALLAQIYPPGSTRKRIAFCAYAATAPNGFLLGALFATLLAEFTPIGWPWAFYVMGIAAVVNLAVILWVVPHDDELHAAYHAALEEQGQKEARLQEQAEGEEQPQAPREEHEQGGAAVHAPPGPGAEEEPYSATNSEHSSAAPEAIAQAEASEPASPASASAPPARRKPRFDWWGCATGMSGLILFNFVWSQAPLVTWGNPYIIVLLIVSVALLAAFFFVETRVKDPLLPTTVWTLQNSIMLGCIASGWASFGILIFYWFRIVTILDRQPILLSVAENSPAGISGICAAFTSVYLLQLIGPGWVMFIAMSAFLTALSLVATLPVHQIYWAQSFVAWIVAPWGMDCSFPSATLIISESLPYHEQGIGGSLVNTVINYSIAFGLGVAGTVEAHVADGSPERGYRGALYLGIGFAGLGVILALINKGLEHVPSLQPPPSSEKTEKTVASH